MPDVAIDRHASRITKVGDLEMNLSDQAQVDALEAMPPVQNCRLIPFERATIVRPNRKIIYLIVQGEKPYVNMKVSLSPWIYVTQPEYWRFDVYGCTGGILLPHVAPYVVYENISLMHGTKGIEVVGFDSFERIDL